MKSSLERFDGISTYKRRSVYQCMTNLEGLSSVLRPLGADSQ